MVNSSTGYVVGGDFSAGTGVILKTIDGGLTWTTSLSTPIDRFISVDFVNQNCGFAVGDNGLIFKYTNVIGINDLTNPSYLDCYPNPSKGPFTISLKDNYINKKIKLEIIDYSGRIISSTEQTITSESNIRITENLLPGIYFYSCYYFDHYIGAGKVLIQY
jgi:hypothetical protein